MDESVKELLREERTLPPIPDSVRARALARARASLAAPAAVTSSAPRAVQSRSSSPALAVGAAAAAVCLTAAAIAALGVHTLRSAARKPPSLPITLAPAGGPEPVPAKAGSVEVTSSGGLDSKTAINERRHRSATTEHDVLSREMDLLRRAQAAYTENDFVGALAVLEEHRRQFPNPRLAEESEALRAWSLVGAGRLVEARRVALGFQRRFPHSVLAPSLQKLVNVTE